MPKEIDTNPFMDKNKIDTPTKMENTNSENTIQNESMKNQKKVFHKPKANSPNYAPLKPNLNHLKSKNNNNNNINKNTANNPTQNTSTNVKAAHYPLKLNTNHLKSKNNTEKTPQVNTFKKEKNFNTFKKPNVNQIKKVISPTSSMRIIPLGGLNEIGKNMTLYEYEDQMFIVDCGLAFPDSDMLGIDIVIPDFTYVEKNKHKLKGIVITHGHEDHIGSLAYLLKKVNVPVYATRLTIGLIENKLKEHGILNRSQLNVISAGQVFKVGCFSIEAIHVNHSIPDAVSLAIKTPVGTIIQTGDFKVDYSPIHGDVIDIGRFSELGKKGVLCLLSDSTNAERPGATVSESKVGKTLDLLFLSSQGKRILVATFASNIHRVQQIVDNAIKHDRKVAVSGRSMVNIVGKAVELGYLKIPKNILIDIDATHRLPPENVVIITTGSQGEPLSALSRMAAGDHRKISVSSKDVIIISATPIPGNEKSVNRVVNDLLKLGAEVIYKSVHEIHVSGHGCQDELKMMLSVVKPKFFLPVHGEFKHLKAHANLAIATGVKEENIYIGNIGQVIELTATSMKVIGSVPAGKTLVDGLGVGDVGSIVLRDRKHLSEDGLIVVVTTIEGEYGSIISGPDIVSRGFVYIRESEYLIEDAKKIVKKSLDDCSEKNIKEWGIIKGKVKDSLSDFIYKKTKRNPMILPIIIEI